MKTVILILSAIFTVSCGIAYFFYPGFDYHVASGVVAIVSAMVFAVSVLNIWKK